MSKSGWYEVFARIGAPIYSGIAYFGELGLFSAAVFRWLTTRFPCKGTITPSFFQIGVRSLPVVALTGSFIGMVLAVQSYEQLRSLGMETRIGSLINMSLVRELGPVLAATMLAGRVGSSMAAELGTMRVTEQIDALTCMGVNPIHYLVVPRFLGCLLLIPVLTLMADLMGIFGGAFYSVFILKIDAFLYLFNTQDFVGVFDLFTGVFKSFFFGAAIGLIGCQRGFHCKPGAEGVGQAATEAFVNSFVAILILDLILGIFLEALYLFLWPNAPKLI